MADFVMTQIGSGHYRMETVLPPFPEDAECDECHSSLQYVEFGHSRSWDVCLVDEIGPEVEVHDRFPGGISDEGDGSVVWECCSCLKQFAPPDEWDFG